MTIQTFSTLAAIGHHKQSRQLEQFLPTLLGAAEEVVHIDYHTGLGRWANCDLLLPDG